MRANIWNEFLGRPQTSFSSETGFIPFTGDISGAWGEINLGIDAQFARRSSFYVSASYLSSLNGDRRGWDGKIGIKYAW
jgi:outer membrane autotransporter protein